MVREQSLLPARLENLCNDRSADVAPAWHLRGRPRDDGGISRRSGRTRSIEWTREVASRSDRSSEITAPPADNSCSTRKADPSGAMNVLMLCTKYPLDPNDRFMTNELAGALVAAGHHVQMVLMRLFSHRVGLPGSAF